ncbi:MAG: hypothetical protein F6K36_29930 [Symploca sp. SIO3C6]|nr:hypothetical protein [Symploca sp. SIO3C6]
MDFRQQWWSETRSLRPSQRRWIVFWKTRWFEAQVLSSMSVIKLQEMLGMHRLP